MTTVPASSPPYTGPSVGTMLQNHTLAREIIARNNDPCPILDNDELKLLGAFVANPAIAQTTAKDIRSINIRDKEQVDASGSLVLYLMYLHVSAGEGLTPQETGVLKDWFSQQELA
ncbi:uncharacterized protein B0I36DRAFT_336271 [Microdochium trichocladiopsis]|uniref:Uncharacterized protein n=1 Tax=Microdochium trichocladiopsis TaxID=1682393 RepID=A0A9P8XV01_9PEZI|nr:uncharacterized protein B0I36DRAFT_336271 [Microdochium trichocladiopsis]KAH7018609.1 hypothetical protein B0I36DRAFT_336271 [Microdochium trichocladiopsis]